MTCIVGITHAGKVIIGGDSAGVSGLDLRVRRDEKVFTNGDFVFGCTSSFRMIQLLRYKLQPPKRHPDTDVMAFMTTTFIDAVRLCLKDGGFAEKKQEAEFGGTFLVGHSGRLFCIYDDYQVAENTDGFDSCGCGESYALGALRTTLHDTNLDERQKLQGALDCAAYFSAGVVGPFQFVEGGAA